MTRRHASILLFSLLAVGESPPALSADSAQGDDASRSRPAHAPRIPQPGPSAFVLSDLADKLAAVVTPCGLFLAGNKGSTNILTLVPGRELALIPPEHPQYWVVDDVLLNASLVSKADIDLPVKGRSQDFLGQHRKWELEWTERMNKWPRLSPVELGSGKASSQHGPYSVWTYPVPRPLTVLGQPIAQVMYLSMVAKDDVLLVMSAPLRTGRDVPAVAALFEKTVRGVQQRRSPQDLLDVTNAIRSISLQVDTCEDFVRRMDAYLSAEH